MNNNKYHILIWSIGLLAPMLYAQQVADVKAQQYEHVQEMPVREMQIRSDGMLPATVSSATLTNMSIREVPQTVNVITEELIQAKGVNDLTEVLRMDSSVNTGGDMLLSRTADQYTIRGFSGSDVQLNNMPLPKGLGYNLDAHLLKNVEIVKGPIGSISGGQTGTLGAYGAGGSVNLILKDPLWDSRGEWSAYMRMQDHGYKFRWTGDLNDDLRNEESSGLAMRVLFAAEYDHPFWLRYGANAGQKFVIAPMFKHSYHRRSKAHDVVTLGAVLQYQNTPTTMGIPVLAGHFVGPYDAWYGAPSGRLNATSLLAFMQHEYKHIRTWTFRYGGSLGYSKIDYNAWGISSSAGRGVSLADYYNQMIADGRAKYEAAWNDSWNLTWNFYGNALAQFNTDAVKHEALMGISYTGSHTYGDSSSLVTNATANTNGYFSLNNPPPFWPNARDYSGANAINTTVQRLGFLLQDVLGYESWRLLLGVRGDMHVSPSNNYAFAWSPRIGVTKLFGEHVALFANAARTTAPNFGYLGANNKELTDVWRTDQIETGIRINPVERLWLSVAWFDIIQNNTPVLLENATNQYYSDGSRRAEGVEISLTGQITDSWTSYLSYTYTRTKNRTTGEVYPTIAPNALALWQKYKVIGGKLDKTVFGIGLRYKDSYYSTFRGEKIADNYTIPSFVVVDCSVEIPIYMNDQGDGTVLRLALYNVFDKKYVQSTRHAVQCTVGAPRTFEIAIRQVF